ncbi:CD99 molecule isoform X1 [Megalops cyprinoides]|uniref:CD99 molecule isoform X1 n=1 Tax=Megalops cyprinoides TaxID=118141 RepID=UPI0018641E0C|nr:CD99 molecule isoform X1 [Megalops cyprinoides]XP_036397258.1 CD99 molecule isoform X1 [Megalops cyprinoides]
MMSYLWIFLLASLTIGANAQELDLGDALGGDDPAPTPAPAPKEPEPPKDTNGDELDLGDAFDLDPTKKPLPPPEDPKAPSGDELDLGDAFGPEPTKKPVPPPEDPKAPSGDTLDLSDALGPDPKPDKPAVEPPKDGGSEAAGGSFGDSDLVDLGGGGSDYKPDGGRGGARAADPASGSNGDGAEEPQEGGSGQIAGIVSAVGVAIIGAASSYFAYQKKKLCFKIQGGDPESANKDSGTQAEPQVLSNLLKSS